MTTSNRGVFRPEPIPAAIPASERGHFEIAPEASSVCGCTGMAARSRPRSNLLTLRDVRGLRMFPADAERGGQPVPQITSTAARP
jgi:hypothetical protein